MTEEAAPSKHPSFHIIQQRDTKNGKTFETRVGVTFPRGNGDEHEALLDSLPLTGRIILRTPKERVEQAKTKSAQRAGKEEIER